MNPEDFVKQNVWFKIGKWKEPGFLQHIILQAEIEERRGVVLPYHPTAYLVAGFKQYMMQSEYDKILHKMQQDLKSHPGQILDKIRDEVKQAIASIDKYDPSEIDASSLTEYIGLIKVASWQSLRFILLGYALELMYPKSLPGKFMIGNEEFTPQKLLAIAGLPKEIAPMIAERAKILEIAILSKKKDVEKELLCHSEQFGWMNSICWWDEPFSIEYYKNEVMKAAKGSPEKELQLIKHGRDEQYSKANEILRVIKMKYPLAYTYIDMIREMADLRSQSWDAVSKAGVRVRPLFKALAEKNSLAYNDLMMLTIDEMVDVAKGNKLKLSKKQLSARTASFTILGSNVNGKKQTLFFDGDAAIRLENNAEGSIGKMTSFKGLTIWPGKVRGKARVMTSPNDIKNIIKGEILVCPMTDPDFMPAIYKASGLVTDQGGVLCHAAIIARELQKPCIVGTRDATKVIKTGDLLELDAESGIVNIIK